MTALTNNAAGADGVTITTANSGLDVVTIGTNAAAVYASNEYRFTTGANSVMSFCGLTTQVVALWPSGLTTHYGGLYVTVDVLPAGTRIIARFNDAGVTADRCTIVMLASGAIRIRNAAAGTVATLTTVCVPGTKYRVEYRADGNVAGAYELHLFVGTATTPIESIIGGTANFGGPVGAGFWGWLTNAVNSPGIRVTGIGMNDVGLPGPGSTTHQLAAAWSAESGGAVDLTRVQLLAASWDAASGGALVLTGVGQLAAAWSAQSTGSLVLATVQALAAAWSAQSGGSITLTDGVPERDLQLVFGRPQTRWRMGPPATGWDVGSPQTAWHFGAPTV